MALIGTIKAGPAAAAHTTCAVLCLCYQDPMCFIKYTKSKLYIPGSVVANVRTELGCASGPEAKV